MLHLLTTTLCIFALAFSGMAGLPACLLADVVLGTDSCPCMRAARELANPETTRGTDQSPRCSHCAHDSAATDHSPPAPGPTDHPGKNSCAAAHAQPLIETVAPSAYAAGEFHLAVATLLAVGVPSMIAREHDAVSDPGERGPPLLPVASDLNLPMLT